MKSFEEYTPEQIQLVCKGMVLNSRWKVADNPFLKPFKSNLLNITGIEKPNTNPDITRGNLDLANVWALDHTPISINILPVENRRLLEEALDAHFNPPILAKPRLDYIDTD